MGKEGFIGKIIDSIPLTARVGLGTALAVAPLACSSGGNNGTLSENCLPPQSSASEVMGSVSGQVINVNASPSGVFVADLTGKNFTFVSDNHAGVITNGNSYTRLLLQGVDGGKLRSGNTVLIAEESGVLTLPQVTSFNAACEPTPSSADAMWRRTTNNPQGTGGDLFDVTAAGVSVNKP